MVLTSTHLTAYPNRAAVSLLGEGEGARGVADEDADGLRCHVCVDGRRNGLQLNSYGAFFPVCAYMYTVFLNQRWQDTVKNGGLLWHLTATDSLFYRVHHEVQNSRVS